MAQALKARLLDELARVGKALGSASRLELLEVLAQGERTVEALAQASGLSMANASRHLQILRESRLVEATREGVFVRYRLAGPEVFELTRSVRTLAERRIAEVERIARAYRAGREGLEPIGGAELTARLRSGTVIVLDVRPDEEFRAGHIAGAISVPLERLAKELRRLPRGKEIVAYCRGPYCVLADRAVDILRAKGRLARRFTDGFPEWRAAGLPIESATAR
jgi:rhodanese-related sulfurtransferase/DNA-binding MarR family transcriptional regulator